MSFGRSHFAGPGVVGTTATGFYQALALLTSHLLRLRADMAEGSSGGIRLKPRDNSDPTAGPSTFSPDEFPDIEFVEDTPNAARREDLEGRRREPGTQTKGEVGGEPSSDGKKHRNLVVCIDGTANQFSEKVRLPSHREM